MGKKVELHEEITFKYSEFKGGSAGLPGIEFGEAKFDLADLNFLTRITSPRIPNGIRIDLKGHIPTKYPFAFEEERDKVFMELSEAYFRFKDRVRIANEPDRMEY